jgi:hypothetical protein
MPSFCSGLQTTATENAYYIMWRLAAAAATKQETFLEMYIV